MKTVKFGEIQTIEISGQTVIGIDLSSYIAHTTVNVPFAADVLVLETIQCKLDLVRGGKTFTIFSDNLRNLFAHSVYLRGLWRAISGSQDTVSKIQLAAAGAVKEIINTPFVILLPSFINCKGSDVLKFSFNLPVAAAAATVDTANSYVNIDFMEAVGTEYGIPYINSYVIQANQNNDTLALGDGVTDVKFFNFDKKSYLLANRVLTNLQLASDKFFRNDTDSELQAKSMMGDFIPSSTFEPYQCYQIYSGLELNEAKLDLQFNSANVVQSKNVVVWSYIVTTPGSVKRGAEMDERHAVRNRSRLNRKAA